MNPHYPTLSSAIRAGAKLHPQGFGSYRSAGLTCTLGAAIEALRIVSAFSLVENYPYINGPSNQVRCPNCTIRHNLFTMIVHLNDDHRWTREHIADFVEQWENEHLGYETLIESEVKEHERAPLCQEAALQG